jgi:fructose-1,6-bisphosphatase/inositol monophosphatase family enzyme
MDLIRAVSEILQETALEEVIPRFGQLQTTDIGTKCTEGDPNDIVTIVDHAVEARLTSALSRQLPGSVVIGEEAASRSPNLLCALDGAAPVWVVDPLDGTKNFAQGDAAFGLMVALVAEGITQAAWMLLPVSEELFIAEKGGGAYLNGVRVHAPPAPTSVRGSVYTRFMSPELARRTAEATAGSYLPAPIPGSAAVEYAALARGTKDFVVYYRLLPWDHAPGALILAEAGGSVVNLNGQPYTPRSASQVTVCAGRSDVSLRVRQWLARPG